MNNNTHKKKEQVPTTTASSAPSQLVSFHPQPLLHRGAIHLNPLKTQKQRILHSPRATSPPPPLIIPLLHDRFLSCPAVLTKQMVEARHRGFNVSRKTTATSGLIGTSWRFPLKLRARTVNFWHLLELSVPNSVCWILQFVTSCSQRPQFVVWKCCHIYIYYPYMHVNAPTMQAVKVLVYLLVCSVDINFTHCLSKTVPPRY